MTPRLEEIVTRNGSFPGAEPAIAGLREVLDVSDAGEAPAPDVAEALCTALDQVGNARVAVPEEVAARLTTWAERAAADPAVPAKRVVSVLVNAGNAGSLAALRVLAQSGRAEVSAAALKHGGDHPLVAGRA